MLLSGVTRRIFRRGVQPRASGLGCVSGWVVTHGVQPRASGEWFSNLTGIDSTHNLYFSLQLVLFATYPC